MIYCAACGHSQYHERRCFVCGGEAWLAEPPADEMLDAALMTRRVRMERSADHWADIAHDEARVRGWSDRAEQDAMDAEERAAPRVRGGSCATGGGATGGASGRYF